MYQASPKLFYKSYMKVKHDYFLDIVVSNFLFTVIKEH